MVTVVLVGVAFALTSLGLVIAWRMESTQGFHAIMNLILIPIWLLSGAFFPPAGVARPLAWLMAIDPLTYGLRSEEHTSELQSRGHLVCRLLLEKKKDYR